MNRERLTLRNEQNIVDEVSNDETIENPTHQEIPANSPTILINETTARFSSATWYEKVQEKVIVLAGVGGIGSHVGFLLSRINPLSLYIYDDDKVETVNMSGQLYGSEDIGSFKVNALAKMVRQYTTYNSLFCIPEKFTTRSEAANIMICGFDSMEARKTFYEKWKTHVSSSKDPGECLFIDGRLAAEEFQILCIKGDDTYNMNRYENEFLFKDSDAEDSICSYKQTTFCASMIASFIVNLFINFCTNQYNPTINRDLPFFTAYSVETMYFKTEM